MKNYKRFINESVEQKYIHISDKLLDILNKMDNKFAKLILKTQSDNTGFRNSFADNLDYDEDGNISFYLNKNGIVDTSRLNKIKPTKIFSKIVIDQAKYLNDNGVTQRDIELFSNDIKPKTDELVEWKGEDILKAYNYTGLLRRQFSKSCANFDQARLTGGEWYEPKKEWYDVYVENPDNISVLVVLNTEGNVVGRRMLFKGEQFEDSSTFKKGEHVGIGGNYYGEGGYGSKYDVIITKWLSDNGYKSFDNRNYNDGNIMLQLKKYKYPEFPPFDNFYINIDNGVISYPSYPRDGGRWNSCYKLTQNVK